MSQPSLHESGREDGASFSRMDHRHGAPRRRGPGGFLRRMRTRMASPGMIVWKGPALRALTMTAVLGCLAFVGAQTGDEEAYGPRMAVDLQERPPEARDAHSSGPAPVARTEEVKPEKPAPCADSEKAPRSTGVLDDGRVVLNEASEQEFTRLPGVGASRAKAIFELRERLGRFRKVSDLLRVKGIGWKTLQRLKELVVLDRPAEESEESASTVENENSSKKGAESGAPTTGDS